VAHELAHEFVFSESRCKKPLLIKGLIIIIGGAGVYLTILLDAVKPRLVGFRVGAFTHIFTHEVF